MVKFSNNTYKWVIFGSIFFILIALTVGCLLFLVYYQTKKDKVENLKLKIRQDHNDITCNNFELEGGTPGLQRSVEMMFDDELQDKHK